MEPSAFSRRIFLVRAGALTAAPALASSHVSLSALPLPAASPQSNHQPESGPVGAALDKLLPAYMAAMNAPGMTVAYVNKAGQTKTACYGFANVDKREPVNPAMLFQIGSISKSFLAIILLQLREEGKLDFHLPVFEYMPWLPIETPYGPVTLHHMLTHTSGLPGGGDLFPSNPTDRARQSWKPGERFHYSNFCFDAMGKMVSILEQRPYSESVQKRILDPLGMTSTSPRLNELIRAQTAESYTPELRDRPLPVQCKLAVAPKIDSDSAAGSIASTPGDMARYMHMLLNRGQAPNARILKEESFALLSQPHIKAEEFGPTASYGYGIAVDKLDGHTILRHTGGMVSFASAMHLDIDGGYAAFASINAQLGYRPNVIQYAIQCMRAQAESKPFPAPPEIPNPAIVQDPKQYEGAYHASGGESCHVTARAQALTLHLDKRDIPLEAISPDHFLSTLPEYSRFAFIFRREESKTPASDAATTSEPMPILELVHGARSFSRQQHSAPAPDTPRYAQFTGMYNSDSPWSGSFRIVERQGTLWIDGETQLIEIGPALFRSGDEPDSPETFAFFYLAGGRAQLVKVSGSDFWRITTEEL